MVQIYDQSWFQDSSVKTHICKFCPIFTLPPQLVNYCTPSCEIGGWSLFFNLLSSCSIPQSFSTGKLWPASKCIQSEWTWLLLQHPGVAFITPPLQPAPPSLRTDQIYIGFKAQTNLNLRPNSGPLHVAPFCGEPFGHLPECTSLLIGSNGGFLAGEQIELALSLFSRPSKVAPPQVKYPCHRLVLLKAIGGLLLISDFSDKERLVQVEFLFYCISFVIQK